MYVVLIRNYNLLNRSNKWTKTRYLLIVGTVLVVKQKMTQCLKQYTTNLYIVKDYNSRMK